MESGVCIRRPYFLDQCRPARFAWHLLPNPTLPSTLALLFTFTELNLLMYTYPPLVPQFPNLTSASCVHVTPQRTFDKFHLELCAKDTSIAHTSAARAAPNRIAVAVSVAMMAQCSEGEWMVQGCSLAVNMGTARRAQRQKLARQQLSSLFLPWIRRLQVLFTRPA